MFNIIERYMSILKREDVNQFAIKNNVYLSEEELNFTYEFVKKNWKIVLGNPNSFQFEKYKNHYTEENFLKMDRLIKEYRRKYQAFL
ncbi:MAG: hypothetical protein HFH86_02970 [Bacilli bacterium]|jgi:hypothetical protein|nr:hypothetical protein [Bacilli bacterium]